MASKTPVEETVEEKVADASGALKSSLYGKALTALKSAHKDEFDVILGDLYKSAGLTYEPRLTPEARKRKELERLAAELGVTIAEPVSE